MYYHTCPLCGANLDPGERCDCSKKISQKSEKAENRKNQINKKRICWEQMRWD